MPVTKSFNTMVAGLSILRTSMLKILARSTDLVEIVRQCTNERSWFLVSGLSMDL